MADYTPEQLHVQQIVHSNADRMVAMLDNAIQLGAEHKNETLPRFEEVDPLEVIEAVLQEISSLAKIHDLRLTREIKTVLPPVVADRKHLYRILKNLLSNACQFTPPGGQVTLRAWVQQEREDNRDRPYLMLAVVDNGIGIPKSEYKRIFEPFYRLKNVLDEGGMGMGLAVVKELVGWHRGRVWVESMKGEGSVFQVALPVTQD
jgi:signal transduction histidine kinase